MIEFLLRRWHRLIYRWPRERPPAHPVSLREDDPLVARVAATRSAIDRILRENILPFWYPGCIDETNGGYRLHHDEAGQWRGPADRHIVTQARTCWFFARLARTDILPAARAAAEHGYRFLRDAFWDREHNGGFFWELAPDEPIPTDTAKRVIAQSFGLYAVAEYADATRDPEARAFAGEIFGVIEQHFRDPVHGGYQRRCQRSWELDPGAPGKTQNDHLHLLESFARLARISDDPLVRDRVRELILTLTSTMARQTAGASTDHHRDDWSPVLDREHAATSYGHDLETVWLVLDACPAVGWAPTLVTEWGLTLLESAARWGWDRRHGGWYQAGPLRGPAHSRKKLWWIQAEALVATLALYRLTGQPAAGELYLKTLDWVVSRQVDWERGDWHLAISESGVPRGDKAGAWKGPYHNGRAMLRCLDLLAPDPVA